MNIDELQAGRELDALIAERVMGIEVEWYFYAPKNSRRLIKKGHGRNEWIAAMREAGVPVYSTDIAAAMQVFLKLSDNDSLYVGKIMASDTFSCYFWSCDTCEDVGCEAESLPLAICRAALKVMQK